MIHLPTIFQSFYEIPDPELPFVSIGELGMLHQLFLSPDAKSLILEFIPSYLGCPASEVLHRQLQQVFLEKWEPLLHDKSIRFHVQKIYAPLWGLSRVSAIGRKKLQENGIGVGNFQCPWCSSFDVEQISAFSSTPCKRLFRCKSCQNPFEDMKCPTKKFL